MISSPRKPCRGSWCPLVENRDEWGSRLKARGLQEASCRLSVLGSQFVSQKRKWQWFRGSGKKVEIETGGWPIHRFYFACAIPTPRIRRYGPAPHNFRSALCYDSVGAIPRPSRQVHHFRGARRMRQEHPDRETGGSVACSEVARGGDP